MDFGSLLQSHLDARGLSHAAFARLVGVKAPMIFAVQSGKRPVPGPRIEKWADALELTGKAREHFIDEAWLARSPIHVQAMVDRLRKQAARH